jgi:hypothetical protein
MTPREAAEYSALRATIRERGTARLWFVLVGFLGWAALHVALSVVVAPLTSWLVPLLTLAITFEIVASLHTAVERVGRYLQVFFEEDLLQGPRGGWEQRVMEYGARFPGSAPDPLFGGYFIAAAILNFVAGLLDGLQAIEYMLSGAIHLVFVVLVIAARRRAGRQRALDLERFRQLREAPTS